VPSEIKLQEIERVIETLFNIQWDSSPEVDSCGGVKMIVMAPENVDFDVLVKELDDAGYLVVI
jgi:hypothetical protein